MKSSIAHFPKLSYLYGANCFKMNVCYLYYTFLKQKSGPKGQLEGKCTEPLEWSFL